MKNLCYRSPLREQSLRKAMFVRASGVPAEDVHKLRLLALWVSFRRIVGLLFSLFWLVLLVGMQGPLGFLKDDLSATMLSIVIAGYLVLDLGRGLLLPPNGFALATTPIRSQRLLMPILARLAGLFFLIGFCCFLIGLVGSNRESALSGCLGLMAIPALGLSWQVWRKGRVGSLLLKNGVAALVIVLMFRLLDHLALVSYPFSGIESFEHLLPVNWGKGKVGALLLAAIYGLLGFLLFRLWREYEFREVPGANYEWRMDAPREEVLVESAELPVEALQEVSFESAPPSGSGFSSLAALFWNQEEREMAKKLAKGSGYQAGLKALLMLVILLLVAVFASLLQAKPDLRLVLVLSVVVVAEIILLRGFKSEVLEMAFSKFQLPNGLLQAAISSFPVSERQLFTLFIKEAAAVSLVVLPLQILGIVLVLFGMGYELTLTQWLVILFFLAVEYCVIKLGSWARYLSGVVRFFQPGIRGDFCESCAKLLFVFPGGVFLFATFFSLFKWLLGEGLFSFFLLYQFLHVAWIGGACWLVQAKYREGKGSAVFPVPKKSFSFRWR